MISSIQLIKTGVMRVRGITWNDGKETERTTEKWGSYIILEERHHLSISLNLNLDLNVLLACLTPQFDIRPYKFLTS